MNQIDIVEKISVMEEGGQKLGKILLQLLQEAKPGMSLVSLDNSAMELISQAGGGPSFTTVEGYKWATCLCVNEVVVHGIPTEYVLSEGDLLTIDIGMLYKGFHTDTAWSKIVGNSEDTELSAKLEFLQVGEKALWHAIEQAQAGNHIGHISQTIQNIIEQAGYSIVKTLVGHGVGRKLHEPPQIPGYLQVSIADTPVISEGQTLAIEVIYSQGHGAVKYERDGWSIATKDSSLSAVFEHTIAVTTDKPKVLTQV